jgi:hypothetical protein
MVAFQHGPSMTVKTRRRQRRRQRQVTRRTVAEVVEGAAPTKPGDVRGRVEAVRADVDALLVRRLGHLLRQGGAGWRGRGRGGRGGRRTGHRGHRPWDAGCRQLGRAPG